MRPTTTTMFDVASRRSRLGVVSRVNFVHVCVWCCVGWCRGLKLHPERNMRVLICWCVRLEREFLQYTVCVWVCLCWCWWWWWWRSCGDRVRKYRAVICFTKEKKIHSGLDTEKSMLTTGYRQQYERWELITFRMYRKIRRLSHYLKWLSNYSHHRKLLTQIRTNDKFTYTNWASIIFMVFFV